MAADIDTGKSLSVKGIENTNAGPGEKRIRLWDAPGSFGLFVEIAYLKRTGGQSKVFYQRRTIKGERCDIKLGAFDEMSLHDARIAAAVNAGVIRAGGDPRKRKEAVQEPVPEPVVVSDAPRFGEVFEITLARKAPIGDRRDDYIQSARNFIRTNAAHLFH